MDRTSQSEIVIRICWALALSFAAHLFLWFGPQIHLSFKPAQPKILEARLVTLPPKPAASSPAKAKPHPKPRVKHIVPKQPVESHAAAESSPETQPAIASSEEQATEKNAPPAEAPPADDPPKEPAKQPFPLPENAEIQFILYKGDNGLSVGKVVHTWQMQGNHYSLTSITQATGIFSLIKSGKMVQTSQGQLTRNGLEPEAFWFQRGQSAESTESALFDYKNKTLTFGSAQNAKTVPLPNNTQDLLSFVYQIAAAPPKSGTVRLFITNGRKLDTYDYAVIGEETLDSPMGKIRALHLSKIHGQDEDGADIWFDIERLYLPVKIRLTDKRGEITAEQVVSEIHIK